MAAIKNDLLGKTFNFCVKENRPVESAGQANSISCTFIHPPNCAPITLLQDDDNSVVLFSEKRSLSLYAPLKLPLG